MEVRPLRRSYLLLFATLLCGCGDSEEVERRAAEQKQRAVLLRKHESAIKHRFDMKVELARDLAHGRISLENAANSLVELNRLDPEVATMLRRREKTDDDFEAAAKDIIKMIDSPSAQIEPSVKGTALTRLREELTQLLNKKRGVIEPTPPKKAS